MLKRALCALVALLFIYAQVGFAASSAELSDRLYLDLDSSGKLTVSNRYLTNYVMRGVNPDTGEPGGMHFIKPSSKAIDFDLVDIEFEGIVPKSSFSFPAKAPEQTTIDLTQYRFLNGNDWKVANVVFQGASLVDMSHSISSGTLSKTEQIDTLIIFALNSLTLAETSISVVHDLESAGFKGSDEIVAKIKPLAEKVANFRDELANLGLLSDITKVWLEIADHFLLALGQDVSNADAGLADFRQYHSIFNDSLDQLKTVAGISSDITADRQQQTKGLIADQYRKLLKRSSDTGVSEVIDLASKTFAQQYEAAETDLERSRLLALYLIQPMEKTFVLFRTEYERQLKQLKEIKAPESQIEAKQKEIDYLGNGRAILLLSNMAFNAPEVMRKIYEEPEFVIPFLWELGAAVAGQVFTLENTETVVKQAWQQYTKLDGRHASFVKIRKTFKNAGSYVKAVTAGGTIANRLLPLVWDIVLAPNRLQTSIIDGRFSPYGPLETLVGVVKVDPVTGDEKLLGGVNQDNNQLALALKPGDIIRIKTGLRRPWQFDPSRAPWDLNPSVVPGTVYDVLITSPDSYSHTYFCARKLLGNTDYALYEETGENWLIPAQQCGVGLSDKSLLGLNFPSTGGDWYDGSKANSTTYNPSDLPARLKLADFTTANAPINVLDYQYLGGRENLQVIASGLSTNNLIHNITLVPELQQVGFRLSDLAQNDGSVLATFDASQIEASASDPIVSYVWNWGDSAIVSISDEPVIQHQYRQPGEYSVSLTLTTDSGAVTEYEKTVTVGTPDAPALLSAEWSVGAPGTIDLQIRWSDSGEADSYTLYWSESSFGEAPILDAGARAAGSVSGLVGGSANLESLLNSNDIYHLVMTAVNGNAESEASNELRIDATTNVIEVIGTLNDTGAMSCSDNLQNNLECPLSTHPLQDGDTGRDAAVRRGNLDKLGTGRAGFDFSKLDAAGRELPADSEIWHCVRDNVTGLVWELKINATDGSYTQIDDLRAMGNNYTWYEPDAMTNGGDPGLANGGICSGSACDTSSYVAALNAIALCGSKNWRVPTRVELFMLSDKGLYRPAVDTELIKGLASKTFWSADSDSGNPSSAWSFSFSVGSMGIENKTNANSLMLVH